MMNKDNTNKPRKLWEIALVMPLVMGAAYGERVQASPSLGEDNTDRALVSLLFEPPNDDAPKNTIGGGTRGNVQFTPPGEIAPGNGNAGGGTRGNVQFLPPGAPAPSSSAGGGTRGNGLFMSPGAPQPRETTGGGTSQNIEFRVPAGSEPMPRMGEETSGPQTFRPPEVAPNNITVGRVRGNELLYVTPLIPPSQIGRTVASHPTFFVYVPETGAKEVLFSLQDANRNHHYQTSFEISGKEGIVSFTLPEDAPVLQMDKPYLWYFVVVDKGEIIRPDSYGVTGWVKRVENPTTSDGQASLAPLKQATLYAQQGIWYDTVKVLASAKLAQPGDRTLAREWKELLAQVGLDAVSEQPITEQW